MSLKVIDSGSNRKLACDFLLVNNTLISYLALFLSYRGILVKLSLLTGGAPMPLFNSLIWGQPLNCGCKSWS